jgi:diguanylate cyclase (GGDEF)-like protein
MNIVVVEDSELIRDQLLRVIAQEPQLHVIGTASEEQEAIRLILDKKPDAALLDLALAPGSGIGVLEKIREAGSKTQVLVLSNYIGNALHDACSLLGISGFYDKSSQIKECLEHLARMLTPATDHSRHPIEITQWADASEREVFDDLLWMACLTTGACAAVLELRDPKRGEIIASVGVPNANQAASILSMTAELCGNEIIEIADMERDTDLATQCWQLNGSPIRHFVRMPLYMPNGAKFGALCVVYTQPRWIDGAQRKALKTISRSVRNEVELRWRVQDLQQENDLRRIAEEQAQHLATHDSLTQLPNRITLTDRINQLISQSQRQHRTFAVMFIDLDRFKQINDTHGHQVGDRVLVIAAERLRMSIRASDTVARLSGDEFIVLLSEFATQNDVRRIARKIVTSLTQPFGVGALTLRVGASVGIAIFPDHGQSFEALLLHADQAMYRDKGINRKAHAAVRGQARQVSAALATSLTAESTASVSARKASCVDPGQMRGLRP